MAPPVTADSPTPTTTQVPENHLQPFFVLHKASAQKPERRSGKVRRKIDLSPSTKDAEKSEAEGREECDDRRFEQLRMEAFEFVWSKIEYTIKDVLRSMNINIFDAILRWVRESFEAIRSCGTPGLVKSTQPYPITIHATSKQLFTGLVLTKNMEFVDDLLTFKELGIHLESSGCHVANLSSLNFSAKDGIGGCLRSLLRQFLMITLDAPDLSILASWYCEQENYSKPVVVIIDDIERCCGSVLSDFILMLSEWVIKIPVILLMGIATTVDAPKNVLSPNVLQHLRPFKFILGSPAERMDAIVESVLVKWCSGFSVGYKVVVFLRNYFLRHDGTLTSFIRALKIACAQHFSTEPLTFLFTCLLSEEDIQGLWNDSRVLFSEVIFKYAFDLPSCQKKKEMAPQSGATLVHGLLELKRLQQCWGAVVLCLHEAGKDNKIQLLDLLCETLDPDMCNPAVSQVHSGAEKASRDHCMHKQFPILHKNGFISRAVRKVRDFPVVLLSKLLLSWEKHTKDVPEIHDKVLELHSLLKFADGKNLKTDVTDISMRHTSWCYPNMDKDSRVLSEKAGTLIETMIRDYMKPVECIPFHEIVCFRNVDKLRIALIGDPRKTIQVDLLEFHKILQCSCCSKNGNLLLPSMHDTSIMYTLAQEHGDLINLHDWYQSFKSTVLPPTSKRKHKQKLSPSPRKRKRSDESQTYSETSIQARFCRAVTELQITGLLRMPSKRRPDYVQRVAFGL